ncbi:HepT-like ribonuclease domain-containing protein [Sulfurovum sp.]
MASFRNFLAHDDEKIDSLIICEEALNRLEEIEEYLQKNIYSTFKVK